MRSTTFACVIFWVFSFCFAESEAQETLEWKKGDGKAVLEILDLSDGGLKIEVTGVVPPSPETPPPVCAEYRSPCIRQGEKVISGPVAAGPWTVHLEGGSDGRGPSIAVTGPGQPIDVSPNCLVRKRIRISKSRLPLW